MNYVWWRSSFTIITLLTYGETSHCLIKIESISLKRLLHQLQSLLTSLRASSLAGLPPRCQWDLLYCYLSEGESQIVCLWSLVVMVGVVKEPIAYLKYHHLDGSTDFPYR
jgi:hypothetical protein